MSVNYILNPNRIITIKGLGRFYVTGLPEFAICDLPNSDPTLFGWIIVEACDDDNRNCVYKLNDQNKPIAKLLIKDREMAEEIAYACNRIKV